MHELPVTGAPWWHGSANLRCMMRAGYGAVLQDVAAAAASPPGPAQQPQSLSRNSITSGALSNSPEEEEEEGDH